MGTQLHLRGARGVTLLLVSAVLLGGCAELMVVATMPMVVGGARVAADPNLILVPKEETNRATLGYAAEKVYLALTQTVERNGRRIVEATPATYVLRVSYPLSFLTNNWGGVITISCTQEGPDTTVTILGSGRDPNYRVKKIGDEILSEVKIALEQMSKDGGS